MLRLPTPTSTTRRQHGVSLVEMMISLVVGLIITAGVLQVFVTSKSTSAMTSGQVEMLENARFAMHTLSQDLRMAGSWGRLAHSRLIDGRKGETSQLANITGDCESGWYVDVEHRLFASNDSNPYPTTCIGTAADYRTGTDVLVARYASPTAILDASVVAGTTYLRSSPVRGVLFDGGSALPNVSNGGNYPLRAYAYYVSDYSESAGDGIPSLRRVLLTDGPIIENELIAAGVEDFQVQFGLDACDPDCDQVVDYYLDPDNAALDWTDTDIIDRILAVRVWVLVHSGDDRNGSSKTYTLGSKQVTTAADGRRRMLLSNVYYLRNRPNR